MVSGDDKIGAAMGALVRRLILGWLDVDWWLVRVMRNNNLGVTSLLHVQNGV